jgi:xanthine dehydrogenase YagS FAD-binding subunit
VIDFHYERPESVGAAVAAMAQASRARFLAGGTNLVDLMREGIETPERLVDVSRLGTAIEALPDGGLRLGAGAKNTAVAEHRIVRQRFPLVTQAILNGASGQIRNLASVAGNLMQRTRCTYFYDEAARCNKRQPGMGCDALEGHHRLHAVLGGSPSCIAVHPSDLCVALAALDARVQVAGPSGERTIAFEDFHRLPGDTPHIETALQANELITAIDLPPPVEGADALYTKVRDRASFAFALVSVAAVMQVTAGRIRHVRLALGGVAHKPWRAHAAEAVLRDAAATPAAFEEAAAKELAAAEGRRENAFKIELSRRLLVSACLELARRQGAGE